MQPAHNDESGTRRAEEVLQHDSAAEAQIDRGW
jgi:hypothetical protein